MKNSIILLLALFLTCMASEAKVVEGKVTSARRNSPESSSLMDRTLPRPAGTEPSVSKSATARRVKADLANVPKDKVIITCSHHNPFKTPNTSPHGSHNAYSLNYKEYLSLFSQYKAVYAWNGHNHENFYYNYKGKDTPHGAPNIQCISVARCTGALRLNREIAAMGEPQGYMVMEARGDSLSWYYKGVGTGKETQMRAYSPVKTGDATVKVNIWNWSEGWSTPEWYENGAKVADMTFTPGIDPAYLEIFNTVTNKTTRNYCTPLDKAILFTVNPTPGVTSGEIRVTDMFGNVYKETVSW